MEAGLIMGRDEESDFLEETRWGYSFMMVCWLYHCRRVEGEFEWFLYKWIVPLVMILSNSSYYYISYRGDGTTISDNNSLRN